MSILWKEKQAITPLDQEITLYQEIWDEHILVGREEMKDQEEVVLETLERPEFIAFSKKYRTYNAVAENILVAYSMISATQGLVKTSMKITKNYKNRLRRYTIWTR